MNQTSPLLLLFLVAISAPNTEGAADGVDSSLSGIPSLAKSDTFRRKERRKRILDTERTTYYTNAELKEEMVELTRQYPDHTNLYSIGKSVNNEDLWVLAIAGSKVKEDEEQSLRPELKFVGNMHGNEVVGRELIIRFADHLLKNYGSNATMTSLLDAARVHLMPTMNPDGFTRALRGDCEGIQGRTNRNDMDLNRNFPEFFDPNHSPHRQPETESVMQWARKYQFVISANFHGGALVANYPYDNIPIGSRTHYSRSPDDDVFRHLASTYADHNLPMSKNNKHPFRNGITNGAEWYPLPGGMQDWMYLRAGCMELTLEVSECKYPLDYSQIHEFWRNNRESMTALLFQGLVGVKGVVVDWNRNRVADADVVVVGREDAKVKTTSRGEFWRLLLPGRYSIRFEADCCESVELDVEVPTPASELDAAAALVLSEVRLGEPKSPKVDDGNSSSSPGVAFVTVCLFVVVSMMGTNLE